MEPVWILRIDEIGLKSAPVRRLFTDVMLRSLTAQASARGVKVSFDRSHRLLRAMLSDAEESDASIFEDSVSHTFGLIAADRTTAVDREPEAIINLLDDMGWPDQEIRTFGVRAKRHGPRSGLRSQEFASELGSLVLDRHPHLSVDLTSPDAWIRVALLPDAAHLIDHRVEGPGGLPSGVQGRVEARLEDDDSLLAAWLCMRRGCRIDPIEPIDEEMRQILRKWDAALGDEEMIRRIGVGPHRDPIDEAWGVVSTSDENLLVGSANSSEDRKVPIATLNPLGGWTDEEKREALALIRN